MTHLSGHQVPIDRRKFWRMTGAFAIGLLFYYAMLGIFYYFHEVYLFDRDNPPAMIEEKRALVLALAEYRRRHKAYPMLPDNPIGDIKKRLAGDGYVLPSADADKAARYVSLDGNSYGLLFHGPGGAPCIVEVDTANTGWWRRGIPKCRF